MSERYIQSAVQKEDSVFEIPLRPQGMKDFVGQESVLERLNVLLGAAKQRGDSLGHCLLSGPPGLGKTTLANIIAHSMGKNIVTTSGAVLEKPGDLAGLLTNLEEGDVLFIDEIHRLNKTIEEYLYPAIEDFSLDLIIDSGPSARSVNVKLNQFTLVGATTKMGLISSPLRSRFALTMRLDYYPPEVLQKVVQRSSRILNIDLSDEGALELAKRSRGTPRVANHLLRWARDYAQIKHVKSMDKKLVDNALEMLAIDEKGLDELDKKIINVMIDHYDGGPVGLSTLAVAIGEEGSTIEEAYEPYLIMKGFLKRTPRGRQLTHLAYEHMGKQDLIKHNNGEDSC
jgi:holliday junction DNA helicase RuvB